MKRVKNFGMPVRAGVSINSCIASVVQQADDGEARLVFSAAQNAMAELARDCFRKTCGSKDPAVRRAAVELLCTVGDLSVPTLEIVLPLLKDSDRRVRDLTLILLSAPALEGIPRKFSPMLEELAQTATSRPMKRLAKNLLKMLLEDAPGLEQLLSESEQHAAQIH